MGFNLKNLIFEQDNVKEEKSTKTSENAFKSKFPSASSSASSSADNFSFPSLDSIDTKSPTIGSVVSCEPYMGPIMDMYEKGFDGLNQDGYDFYEYFKAVVEGGADNKAVYPMAFKMGNAMGGNIDKKTLLEQASFYVNKLNEVHSHYKSEGENKKSGVSNEKASLEVSLKNEISGIDAEITRLQNLRVSKQNDLSKIDTQFTPKITEIECKLQANDVAKDKLVSSINVVINGIKNNL